MSFSTLDALVVLLAMFPSVIGAWGIGNLIGAQALWSRVFIGLITISGISAVFVFFCPNAVRPLTIILTISGLIVTYSRIKKAKFSIRKLFTYLVPKKSWIPYLVAFLLIFLFCYKLLPWFYIFENHDVMYFGWLQSLFEYTDNNAVIVPTAWPLEMGSTHTLPGMVIATSGVFLPSITLVQAIFIRSILIIVAFSAFAFGLIKFLPGRNIALFSGLMVAAIIWGQDIGYELTISSYLYVLILILITDIAWRKNENTTIQFWLIIFLALAKAPIILIALGTAFTFGLSFRKEISWKKIWLPSSILVANLATVLTAPQTNASADTGYSVMGINLQTLNPSIALSQWANSFSGLLGWNVDWFRTFALPSVFQSQALGIAIFIYTIVIVYGSYFLFRLLHKRFLPSNRYLKGNYLFLDVYMCLSLISWVFVRNGEIPDLGHQAHAYLLASVVSFTLGVQLVQYQLSNFGAVSLIVISALVYSQSGTALNSRTLYQRLNQNSDTSVRLVEGINLNSADGFYIPDEGENLAKSQVIASILGLKLKYEAQGNYEGHSQVNNFVKEVNK